MPDKILFTGDFDQTEIVKGVDSMIAALKRAQSEQDNLKGSVEKLNSSYDKARESVEKLQQTSGKSIAPTLNDTKISQQMGDLTKGVEQMTEKISKKVLEARQKLADLQKTQEGYKNNVIELNGALRANQKEFNGLEKELNALIRSGKGASAEAKELRKNIDGLTGNTAQMKKELAETKINLTQTSTAMKAQAVEVKKAETAGNAFVQGTSRIYGELRKLAYLIPGMGIAGLVTLISGPLVDAFSEWINKTSAAEKASKRLKDVMDEARGGYQKAVVEVTTLSQEIELAKKGFIDKDTVVQHYNETIGKTTGKVNDLDEAETALVRNGQAYIQMTLYKAAANIALEKAAQKAFDALEASRKNEESNVFDRSNLFNIRSEADAKRAADQIKKNTEERKKARVDAIKEEQNSLLSIAESFNQAAAQIAKGFNFNFLDPKEVKSKTGKRAKEIANIYFQELLKLQSDIAKITENGFTSEATITKAIEADFRKRDQAFQKAFKNKQLTAGQLESLQENLKNLQELTLKKSLDDFAKQKQEYLEKINDEISSLQLEESRKRLESLQDSFEKEKQVIELEQEKLITSLTNKRDKTISDVLKSAAKNGLTAQDVQPQIDQIKDTYSKLLDDLDVIKNQKLQKLSFDTFQKLAEESQKALDRANLNISRAGLIDIKEQTALFQAGKISYEQYQKELTRIAKEESDKRAQIEIDNLRRQIRLRENELFVNGDKFSDVQKDALLKQITDLQKQLSEAERKQVTGEVGKKGKSEFATKADEIIAYAGVVQQVTESVINAWGAANEAEQRALDRSIAIQQTRVEAARRIAERGNSEYLRMEEEREQKLLIQKENAARRQMAINAAVQASQLMVAITGAIAKIAEPGVGTFEVIASIGVIIGALASGFALVKSLTANQPTFFKGTEDTGDGGDVDDKKGFHAILHPHERVLTAEENKKLRGLSNKQVIEMVERYRVNPAPRLNYEAMDKAVVQTNTYDERMAGIMEENNREMRENNHLQRKTHRLLRSMGVNVNVDRNGLAVSVLEATEEIKKSMKS